MKNLFKISFAALLLGAFAGCSEAPEADAYVPEFSNEEITATISEETRTLLGAENQVLWSEGDAIAFFNKSTMNLKYVLKEGAGETTATFGYAGYTGTHAALTQNYAVYPWSESVVVDETNQKVTGLTLAGDQNYTVGQPVLNGAPMLGVSTTRDFSFKNTIGLIRVNVKAELPSKYELGAISFVSKENLLSGDAEVSLEDNKLTVVTGEKSVEVTLAENAALVPDAAVATYALVPATAFAAGDLTITLHLTDLWNEEAVEVVKVVPSAFELERSKIFTFNITVKEEDVTGSTEDYEQDAVITTNEELATAVAAAADGDVLLLDGEELFVMPHFTNKALTFKSVLEPVTIKEPVSAHNNDYFSGSTLSFEGVTLVGASYTGSANGFVQAAAENYTKCTFKNFFMFAGDEVTLNECTFVGIKGQYFWTGSAEKITFTKCVFNGVDRAVKVCCVGNQMTTSRVVTFDQCTFNASTETQSEKAVFEIDSNASPYELNINTCTKTGLFNGWFNAEEKNNNAIKVYLNGSEIISGQDALVDAATNGGTVTLSEDVVLTDGLVVAQGVELVLDLNGFSISQEKEQSGGFSMITNKGTLTIKNSGSIVYADNATLSAAVNYVSNTIQNSGTLTIEEGVEVINNSNATISAYGYPHAIDNSGTLTINGGTFTNNADYSSLRIWCTTDNDTIVTINGGEFNGSIDFHNVNGQPNKGTLTITAGTFNADNYTRSAVRLLGFGADVDEINAYISGGEFNGEIALRNWSGGTFNSQVFFISGGSFANDPSEFVVEGYAALDNGEWYVVVTDDVDALVSTPDALQDAVA